MYTFILANECASENLVVDHGTVTVGPSGAFSDLPATISCDDAWSVDGENGDSIEHTLVCNADGTVHVDYPLPTCEGKCKY